MKRSKVFLAIFSAFLFSASLLMADEALPDTEYKRHIRSAWLHLQAAKQYYSRNDIRPARLSALRAGLSVDKARASISSTSKSTALLFHYLLLIHPQSREEAEFQEYYLSCLVKYIKFANYYSARNYPLAWRALDEFHGQLKKTNALPLIRPPKLRIPVFRALEIAEDWQRRRVFKRPERIRELRDANTRLADKWLEFFEKAASEYEVLSGKTNRALADYLQIDAAILKRATGIKASCRKPDFCRRAASLFAARVYFDIMAAQIRRSTGLVNTLLDRYVGHINELTEKNRANSPEMEAMLSNAYAAFGYAAWQSRQELLALKEKHRKYEQAVLDN